MRRLIVLGVVGLAAVAMAVTAFAAPNDAKGPDCVDVNNGNFIYNAGGSGIVSGSIAVDGNACRQATYTLYVLDEQGSTTPLTTDEGSPNPVLPTSISFATGTIVDDDEFVCVYITTSIGGHTFDVAPDGGATNCKVLKNDGTSPGGSGFE